MAKKILDLPFSMEEVKTFCQNVSNTFKGEFWKWIDRMRTRPFVIVVDERDKCKRVFFTKEDADKWFAERDSEEGLTPETAALEFPNIDGNGTIPGTEQYQLTCAVVNDGSAAMKGTEGINLMFNFSTVDRINNAPLGESVDISFTFSSSSGIKKSGARFEYSTEVTKYDITDFLEDGENTITMVVRGRSTGLSRTVIATFTLIDLALSSDFNIAKAQVQGQSIIIPYVVTGPDAKNIQFYIDGQSVDNINVGEGESRDSHILPNTYSLGHHTLQMKATMNRNDKNYESSLLYFDFVNNGSGLELTTALIKAEFPSGTNVFQQSNPGLIGEQYIDYILQWAYFSTQFPRASVLWKTKVNGVESVVGSREIDEKEGQVDVMPDPVQFQPDQVGTYDLYATIDELKDADGNLIPIGQFTINVKPNSAGLSEKTTGLSLKLTGLGRSNNEPADTRSDWSYNGYKTVFSNMGFDSIAGYTGKAVRFDGGATGINDCKPFAAENDVLTNGMAMTFHFRTRNVVNENIPLVEIGTPDSDDDYFAIYGKKVVLKPSMGETLEYAFASEEDTHLAVVIYPKEFGADKQMMFFILNGIQAPGKQYSSSAMFRIGSYADKDSSYGKIHFGTSSKDAAIDIYSVRSYIGTISMWNGMNTYIIDHGGNVGVLMKKNNIFRNNAIETPNTDAIQERFRTIEVIGDLGSLEDATGKVSFRGSVIYRDPFDPKFNFERTDGKVFFETAGQSRVSDLMAKSFHIDLNDDETVATKQNGVLTHKNRVIFAEKNVYENAVRVDLCGADSSISRNAAHFKLVNDVYPNVTLPGTSSLADAEYPYPLRTPAMQYAYSQYAKDMQSKYGGLESDWQFPHNIRLAPDSVPVVILWHKEQNDALQVYGIGVMMQEKKAAYANGNHSIYLKERLPDGRLDPYDRLPGVNGDRGWDNEGTIEMEYLRADDFTQNISAAGWNATSRELAFEISYPKNSDFKKDPALKEWTWKTFYDEYISPLARICNDQDTFDREIENVIWMPSFAMYYNKCLDKKCCDSLCRNMHVLRCFIKGKWVWFAKWWDVDVQSGLYQSGAYGVPPSTTRQSKDERGVYIMQGHDVRLWNRLEQNAKFKQWCYEIAKAAHLAGWDCTAEKESQDAIVDAFCEGLYNLDGLQKYLSSWRKGNDYMVRMQGSSVPYRHGFLNDSYAIREAEQAIGDYSNRVVEFRAMDAYTKDRAIRIKASQRWWYGIALGEQQIYVGIVKEADEVFSLYCDERTLPREYLRIYGADKMKMIDISSYLYYFSDNISLKDLIEVEELYVGYPDIDTLMVSDGFNPLTSISFNGLDKLSRIKKFSIIGLLGVQTIDLSTMPLLTHFYAAGSGLLAFKPAIGARFSEVTLPATIEEIVMEKSTLGTVEFYNTINTEEEHTAVQTSCPTTLRTLTLTGMGDDEGTHALVHQWCQMLIANPDLVSRVSITYRSINWIDIPKEDLFVLARIPKSQRNLSGYVKCDTVYTDEERKVLTDAFGSGVFNINEITNTLVCDANASGLAITITGDTVESTGEGSVTMEQGNTAQLTAAGFPISGSNAKNYRYRVFVDNQWTSTDDALPEVLFGDSGNFSLNSVTGAMTINECPDEEVTFRIGVIDVVEKDTGELSLTIKPCSYPNHVEVTLGRHQADVTEIDGELQIISQGSYVFDAIHTPTLFTGTMKQDGGQWTLVGADDTVVERNHNIESDPMIQFALQVKSVKKDLNLKLRYKSLWKNNHTLSAKEVLIAVVSVIEQLVINEPTTGNPPLFLALEQAGVAHEARAFYSSIEVKQLIGDFNITDNIIAAGGSAKDLKSLYNGQYNVLHYLKNVTGIDVHDADITETIDLSVAQNITDLNAQNTYASIKF